MSHRACRRPVSGRWTHAALISGALAVLAGLLAFGETGHVKTSAIVALITLLVFPVITAAFGFLLIGRFGKRTSDAADQQALSLSGQSARMHERPFARFYLPVAMCAFAGVGNLFRAFDPEPRRIVGGLTVFFASVFFVRLFVKVWRYQAPRS